MCRSLMTTVTGFPMYASGLGRRQADVAETTQHVEQPDRDAGVQGLLAQLEQQVSERPFALHVGDDQPAAETGGERNRHSERSRDEPERALVLKARAERIEGCVRQCPRSARV